MLRVAEEIFYHVKTLVYGVDILEREEYPPSQQSRSHRAHSAVYDAQKAFSVLVHAVDKFKVSHGELVESHKALLLDAFYAVDVAYLGVFRDVEIV